GPAGSAPVHPPSAGGPAVGVVEADDVVLAEVGTALHLDDVQLHLAGVLQAVDDPEGNIGGLVLGEQQFLVAAGHQGGAAHHDPVLGAVVVLLQGQALPGLDHDALHLEALAAVDGGVVAPGAEPLAVYPGAFAALAFQVVDHLLDVLGALPAGDEDGIVGLDDHQVVHPEGGDQRLLGTDQAVVAVDGQHLSPAGIAAVVPVEGLPQGLPGAHIAPA